MTERNFKNLGRDLGCFECLTDDVSPQVFITQRDEGVEMTMAVPAKMRMNKHFSLTEDGRMLVLKRKLEINFIFMLASSADSNGLVWHKSENIGILCKYLGIDESKGYAIIGKMCLCFLCSKIHSDDGYYICFNPQWVCYSNLNYWKDTHSFVSAYSSNVNATIQERIDAHKLADGDSGKCVYICRNSDGHTKIGKTTNIDSRLRSHKTSNPSIELLFKIKGYTDEETSLHKTFNDKRISNNRSEWFNLDDADLQWIKDNYVVI